MRDRQFSGRSRVTLAHSGQCMENQDAIENGPHKVSRFITLDDAL